MPARVVVVRDGVARAPERADHNAVGRVFYSASTMLCVPLVLEARV